MIITAYSLVIRDFQVMARIGVHEFERTAPQRLMIGIEIELEPVALPDRDDIAATLDYDWVRDEICKMIASRHFDLQETLVRSIVDILARRMEIRRVVVETAKLDVYTDVAAVGCRIEARR